MSEEELIHEAHLLTRWQRHKYMVMVGGTILISLFLVMISLHIYKANGAALLDLSRPGYQSVRDQVNRQPDTINFSSTGPLDSEALQQFSSQYASETQQISPTSFGGNPMSDRSLGLQVPSATTKK